MLRNMIEKGGGWRMESHREPRTAAATQELSTGLGWGKHVGGLQPSLGAEEDKSFLGSLETKVQ